MSLCAFFGHCIAPQLLEAHRSHFTDFTPLRPAHDCWTLGALLFALYFRRPLFATERQALLECTAAVPAILGASTDAASGAASMKASAAAVDADAYRWSARRPGVWRHVRNAALVDLLDRLLVAAPRRLTMEQVLAHGYFAAADAAADEASHVGDDEMLVVALPTAAAVEAASGR